MALSPAEKFWTRISVSLILGLGMPEAGCVRFFSMGPEEAWKSQPSIEAIGTVVAIVAEIGAI
jgi:hypothetical protein